jgi:hypothetical protein
MRFGNVAYLNEDVDAINRTSVTPRVLQSPASASPGNITALLIAML